VLISFPGQGHLTEPPQARPPLPGGILEGQDDYVELMKRFLKANTAKDFMSESTKKMLKNSFDATGELASGPKDSVTCK